MHPSPKMSHEAKSSTGDLQLKIYHFHVKGVLFIAYDSNMLVTHVYI